MIRDVDDILKHYGTKGMKWGVRKDQATNAAKTAKTYLTPTTQEQQTWGVKVGNKKLVDIRKEKQVPLWKRGDTSSKEAAKILTLKHKDKTIVEIRSQNSLLRAGKFYIHESYAESGIPWAGKIAKKYKDAHWVDGKLVIR